MRYEEDTNLFAEVGKTPLSKGRLFVYVCVWLCALSVCQQMFVRGCSAHQGAQNTAPHLPPMPPLPPHHINAPSIICPPHVSLTDFFFSFFLMWVFSIS